MKVYILIAINYDYYEIIGVYYDKEKAKENM